MTGELHEVSAAIGKLTGVTESLQKQVEADRKSRADLYGAVNDLKSTITAYDGRIKDTEKGVADYRGAKHKIVLWFATFGLGGTAFGAAAGRFWDKFTG